MIKKKDLLEEIERLKDRVYVLENPLYSFWGDGSMKDSITGANYCSLFESMLNYLNIEIVHHPEKYELQSKVPIE